VGLIIMPDLAAWVVVVALLVSALLVARRARRTISRWYAKMGTRGSALLVPEEEAELISRERRRIASELHDGALRLLLGALTSLRLAEGLLDREHPAFRAFQEGSHQLQTAMDAMRNAIFPLLPAAPYASRLASRVNQTIQRFAHTIPVSVHLQPLPDLSGVPSVEEAVAGILEEALANAGRHAQARNIWVDVTVDYGAVTVLVRDDGVGFDLAKTDTPGNPRKHFGLHLIREHARLAGGYVIISSQPQAGTVVQARLPLPLSTQTAYPALQDHGAKAGKY